MSFVEGWALGDEDGPEYFLEGATVREVIDAAREAYPKHTRVLFEGDIQQLEEQESSATFARGNASKPANEGDEGNRFASDRLRPCDEYDDRGGSQASAPSHALRVRVDEGRQSGRSRRG